ncbi:MAG: S41 family peptidase [Gemmatimonadota bacterium]
MRRTGLGTPAIRRAKRLAVVVSSVSLALAPGGVRGQERDGTARSGELSVEEWREDLRFLHAAVLEVHPDPFYAVGKEELEARLGALDARLPSLNGLQTVAALMGLVAVLRDGHTSIEPSGPHGFHWVLPLRFRWFPEGLFVTATSTEYGDLVGAEVTGIGGLSVQEAYSRVAPMVSSDNEQGRRSETAMYLSVGDLLAALGITENPARLPLTLRLPSGVDRYVEVAAVDSPFEYDWLWSDLTPPTGEGVTNAFSADPGPRPRHARARFPELSFHEFEILAEDSVAYVQMNAVLDQASESFEQFQARLVDAIRVGCVHRVIIDLRFNPGGNGYLLQSFADALASLSELQEPGSVVVLTSKRTFSAGVVAAALLKKTASAVIVGEPGGAGFNFFSDVRSRTLPNSGLKLWVSSLYWEHGEPGDRSGTFEVDVPVPWSAADYFAGRDPVLRAAIGLSSAAAQPAPDLSTPEGLVQALYGSLSFPRGGAPEWDFVRGLFRREATVVFAEGAGGPLRILDVHGFVEDFQAFYDNGGLVDRGFAEVIERKKIVEFGALAHAFVVFQPRVAGRPAGRRGLDSIEMTRLDGRWWITNITTDWEGPGQPIPARLDPRGEVGGRTPGP